jgi:hypothetical protein
MQAIMTTLQMPFRLNEILAAHSAYQRFIASEPNPHHLRYIFPLFEGTYFAYRKIDVFRVANIAKSISKQPFFMDVGCGYGDFLRKVREYISNAIGIEKDAILFYVLNKPIPDYIYVDSIERFDKKTVDIAFVGWMEPGIDFREFVASVAKCIITTFDEGGQCGINGGCEYEEFGFQQVARWRTPSWIDVNTELMNKYYTPLLSKEARSRLESLRSAHNLWYVYARKDAADRVRKGLYDSILNGEASIQGYDFESVLDECGYHFKETLQISITSEPLWEVIFDEDQCSIDGSSHEYTMDDSKDGCQQIVKPQSD